MKIKKSWCAFLIPFFFLLIFSNVHAATFANPISQNSIVDLFYAILTSLRSWIAVVAIIFLVIGGLMYMMSAGDEKMITRAKSTITSALIGLAIAVAAPTFLKELLAILGNSGGGNAQSLINNSLSVQQIAMKVLSFLLSVVGVLGIIGLVMGGSFYLTAYGDEKRIDKGKQIITYSIIGIVVALAALLIVKQLMALLT